ncbi:uncharacterized protein r-cup [Drosophila virilis]|uniref:uncharacterized protein r-cup n=1 Tax=Drosophila virilis TaxID=7244 RepID=UPI0013960BF5|nr:uncharacterized protein LOC6632017 [Drosophila virilis]
MKISISDPVVMAPVASLVPRLQPWEAMGWSAQQHRRIWRSWAQTFARNRNNMAAIHYFKKCIDEHDDGHFVTLCMRSNFNRQIAQAEKALDDSRKAAKIAPWSAIVNLQIADALYDLNKFEENKMSLHNDSRLYSGTKKLPFNYRLLVVNSNFEDNLGDSLRPFFLRNLASMRTIYEEILKPEKPAEASTRWKTLKDLNECDVNSLIEKKEIRISPLEAARRKRKTKIYYQSYLNDSWIDIAFLKTLRHNPIVLLDKYYNSAHEREKYLNNSYECIKKFTKMLHARSPMYNQNYQRMANPDMLEQMHQDNKNRIQYQTRRNMLSILRTIRALREQKDITRLRKFVSKVMGEFVVLKTRRIMPWKIEFMNEVYNHLALSLCEMYSIPDYKVSPYDNDSMCRLLGVNPLKPTEPQVVVFGDRSTYVYEDSGAAFEQAQEYKRAKAALDKRLYFAKLPIERSYLLYEIADCLLSQNHLVHCLLFAKSSIDEAVRANSKIWQFLATMLQAKAHAILCKYERQAEVLNNAYKLAKELKSPSLCTFIELCRMLNRDYMTLRKVSILVSTKRLRCRISNRSSCMLPNQISADADSHKILA